MIETFALDAGAVFSWFASEAWLLRVLWDWSRPSIISLAIELWIPDVTTYFHDSMILVLGWYKRRLWQLSQFAIELFCSA